MNSDLQSAINQNIQWSELAPSLKQSLGSSQKEYEKHVISHSINNQLRYRENLVRFIYKDEKKYYEELLNYSRDNLMLYPYHLADVIVKGLRVTPFQYYVSIIESMMDHDKSYDSIPNFTAIDCLRLLGIGRNEYIELMNQCRSGKRLFRRKSISKNLLPVNPIDIHIEPWWLIETGFITDEDIKIVTETEKALVDCIIDNGKQNAGNFDYSLVRSLYKKGLIYLDVPIEDGDHIVVLTLEGFVMNRVLGDYLEKLLYKILVSIDERTSVSELAALLQKDIKSVKNAVSLFCRLNLAKKKEISEVFHCSWNEINNSPTNSFGDDKKMNDQISMDDPLLKELNDALIETSLYFKEKSDMINDVGNFEVENSLPLTQKRIAFFFDSTLTAFLMMGNLSPDLKKHAVKMFEAGKLTDEDLDEFLNELKNVSLVRDESEGEAKRYFDHALILRETVLALRSKSNKLIDLIRCESLLSLDQEINRFLVKNYFLLISMAPLSKEVKPIVCPSLPHLGPPALAVNSIWFKLFLYDTVGCGPPSVLFPRGIKVKKIPKIFRNTCDKVLITSWGHEPISLPLSNMLFALNDALLYTPVLVQSYGDEEKLKDTTCFISFPFKEDLISDFGIKWLSHDGIITLSKMFNLNHTCGYITMLRTNNHSVCKSCLSSSEKDSMEEFKNKQLPNDMPINGITSEENEVLLQQELDNAKNFFENISTTDIDCKNKDNLIKSKPSTRNVKLSIQLSSTARLDDWCILDCLFGVPLFDSNLNDSICNAIVRDGLWLYESLEKLIQINENLSSDLTQFIKKYHDSNKFHDDFLKIEDDDIPWPVASLMFHNGKLSEWDFE